MTNDLVLHKTFFEVGVVLMVGDSLGLPQATIKFQYTNYRGETSLRTCEVRRLWYGSTQFHPEPQWFLDALDLAKQDRRDFALKDIQGFLLKTS